MVRSLWLTVTYECLLQGQKVTWLIESIALSILHKIGMKSDFLNLQTVYQLGRKIHLNIHDTCGARELFEKGTKRH